MPMPIEDITIDLCNTVVCDEYGNIIVEPIEEENTMEYIIDCASGPDYGTEEYWNSEGGAWWNKCVTEDHDRDFCDGYEDAPFCGGPSDQDVELGTPQVEKDDVLVELGPATVIERQEEEAITITEVGTAPELPATGGEFGFGVLGLLAIAAGVTVLRRNRKA